MELDGFSGLAQVGVGQAQVAQSVTFAPSVADLSGDGQVLLVELDGLAVLAQGGVGSAQVAQVCSFAPSVPDLSIDG